jgi:putative ABC transport system permease protein
VLGPRWRKVLHDLWSNKARTLLVIASIAVGVFAIGVITGAYVLLTEDLSASYAAVNPANIDLITDPFDPAFVDAIRGMDGIADAEGRRSAVVRVRTGPDAWDTLELVAVPDIDLATPGRSRPSINQLLPRGGAAAPLDREVILERKTLAGLGVQVGDLLAIELADGTVKQMRVAGAAQEPTVGYGGILGDLKGFITLDTLEWLGYPLDLNRLVITLTERQNDKAHIQQMAGVITDRLERSGREVYRTRLSPQDEHPLASIIQALLGVLIILGVLVVFLSGSLISNTMSALLNQHLRQIGVMKLVGARQRQIVGMYLTLIVVFGIIALLVAVPLGGWGAFALSGMAAGVVNFVLRDIPLIPVVPLAVAIQVAVALLVPVGAGMLPVIKGSRTTVQKALTSTGLADAIHPRGNKTEKGRTADAASDSGRQSAPTRTRPAQARVDAASDIEHGPHGADAGRTAHQNTSADAAPDSGHVVGRWIPQPARSRVVLVSLRNTFRRKGRLALTLFTLTLGGAIFMAVLNTQAALDHKVEESIKYFQADLNLDLARPYRIAEVEREAMSIPGVERVEVWTSASAELASGWTLSATDGSAPDTVALLAPPADSSLIDPTVLEGRWLLSGDENAIVVNEAFWADRPGLKAGDVLRLKIAGKEKDWTVVGIFQYTGVDELIGYVNYDHLARELNQVNRASVYRIVTEEHSLAFQKRVGLLLEERFRALDYRIASVESGAAFAASITDVLRILVVILLAMALLTALVGSIGLTGTMSMNVLERTREIGVLRAIGAHNQIVSKLVIVEGLLIGLISFALGSVLSLPITSLLSNVISLSIFNSPAEFIVTARGFGIWLGLVLLLSTGASLLPARSATQLTIREVLAYE